MKQEFYSNEQLPCMLNAKDVERYMRISRAEAYEQMHSEGFPLIRIGKRMLAPRDKFLEWVEEQVGRQTKAADPALRGLSLSKNFPIAPVSGIMKETGVYLWNSGEKMHGMKSLSQIWKHLYRKIICFARLKR
jgi:hypothetical protein